MAKLSDLHLEGSGPPQDDQLRIHRQQAEEAAQRLREMEEEARYGFAFGTIVDMRITIEQTGRVTEGQLQAIRNIQEGARKGEDKRERGVRSRRYEGWESSH